MPDIFLVIGLSRTAIDSVSRAQHLTITASHLPPNILINITTWQRPVSLRRNPAQLHNASHIIQKPSPHKNNSRRPDTLTKRQMPLLQVLDAQDINPKEYLVEPVSLNSTPTRDSQNRHRPINSSARLSRPPAHTWTVSRQSLAASSSRGCEKCQVPPS